jgi:hypothetical protein
MNRGLRILRLWDSLDSEPWTEVTIAIRTILHPGGTVAADLGFVQLRYLDKSQQITLFH